MNVRVVALAVSLCGVGCATVTATPGKHGCRDVHEDNKFVRRVCSPGSIGEALIRGEAIQHKWMCQPLLSLESDITYSNRSGNVRVLSDETLAIAFSEGGDCSMEETSGSKWARVLHGISERSRERNTKCKSEIRNSYGNTSTVDTECTPPPAPKASPQPTFEKSCNPTVVVQFFVRDYRIVRVQMQDNRTYGGPAIFDSEFVRCQDQ